jgi:hypothetical protein
MLLVITSRSDQTADYLCRQLTDVPIAFARLDTDLFRLDLLGISHSLGATRLRIVDRWYSPSEFSHVWFRRPEPLVRLDCTPEEAHVAAEWSEAIEGFLGQIPAKCWMNHPSNNVRASHKIEQLVRARALGLRAPHTLVTQDPPALLEFWRACNRKVIVKPMSYGYIERDQPEDDTHIYTNEVLPEHLVRAIGLPACPTLFQERVDKAVDVRITIVDGNAIAVALRAAGPPGTQRLDIRRDSMRDVSYETIALPTDIHARLAHLVDSYSLRFAAIDMAIDRSGEWVFFELNPNGQWAWLDQLGAANIAAHFATAFARTLDQEARQ